MLGKGGNIDKPNRCVDPVTYSSLNDDCTVGICVELSDGVDQLLTHVVPPHGGPQCIMPHTIKRLFEVYEDVVYFLLVYPRNTEHYFKFLCNLSLLSVVLYIFVSSATILQLLSISTGKLFVDIVRILDPVLYSYLDVFQLTHLFL